VKPLTLRKKIGCWLHERWRMEAVLRMPNLARRAGLDWLDLCNRHECLVRGAGVGRICDWSDSSLLTACRTFPRLGGRLLQHVAREHPFSLQPQAGVPAVSAIVPVRGTDRFQALAFVATALRAVGGSAAEVLLCEHDETPRLEGDWPEGVRHVFVPAAVGEAFNKSKALNAGALAARHPVLLLHDADVWPPEDYVAKCLDFMAREGWEAVRPIRFLFLLDAESSSRVIASASVQDVRDVAQVQQNNPGLSAFVRKDVYLEIGGHDERFTGWGWEDVEFLDRLKTRRLYPGSFLPAVHLWHDVPPAKKMRNWNRDRLADILREPVGARIIAARRQLEGGRR
jgi:hypothetical protein